MIDQQKNTVPLDLSYLKDMSGDSAEFMIEMIDMFKLQTPLYVADLEQAVNASDWEKAAGFAHKIKPTFSYVGREDAREHLQEMENNLRNGSNTGQIPEAMKELLAFIQVLYRQLDEARADLEARG
ncbi:Hpt domain-containing protein [Pedobacter antarcticus]|uniref:Histidine phosphotransferase n=2 Tax=Pedobacter antarcticus TaxID=34086 RepID=A0A081PIV8_9SPHI|nr:Hpt domain-containing protein [Pedobacter antarcticus]KEQ30631.1 histidine phosphotransferase [Pedobacter antarcticus 4BY]SDM29731.1 HPt (histidine-containing phosphotransfer) domain-containing protein [Pedobacter antarcticus]SFF19469.1 HPt (histidine-containing phosphotransfer) domain-containing protein [Pedobacter antarcticus]